MTGAAAHGRARGMRHVAGLMLVPILLLMLLAFAGTASASPGTLRVLGMSPSLGHHIDVAAPGGGTFSADPGHARVRITPQGATASVVSAWCVDATRSIDVDIDYPVDLQGPADAPELGTAAWREAGWLIANANAMIAAASNPGREAAAVQIAIWQLTGQAADIAAPTADAALNARVAALRAMAAGRTPVTDLALTAPAGAVSPGTAVTLTVTATPGASVTLEVTAGSASLSATQVAVGDTGSATVTLTPTAAGDVSVTARATGQVLRRAVHLPGHATPQDLAYLMPVPLTATAGVSVTTAPAVPETPVTPTPGPTPTTPTTPPVRPAGVVPARLGLVKLAPSRAYTGSFITYTLRVTNRSNVIARGVVVRDPLPRGTVLPVVPSRAKVSGGIAVWRLGNIGPRRTVTVRMRLRTVAGVAGPRLVNVARASASNAATVTARAVTRLGAARPAAVQPAVTG